MLVLLLAGVAGALVTMAAMLMLMRTRMIRRYRFSASFDQVCDQLETAVRSVPGWGTPIPAWDLHAAVSNTHSFRNVARKKIFFICKAEYANRIIDAVHHMGAMMPCAWAVYETKTGDVFLSKMNISMMGKMFSGNVIGRTMGKVAKEERLMLEELKRLLA